MDNNNGFTLIDAACDLLPDVSMYINVKVHLCTVSHCNDQPKTCLQFAVRQFRREVEH